MSTFRLDYVDNWSERARKRLPSQFRHASRINALMSAVGQGVQILEDDAYEIYHDSLLETADGDLLDQWGDFVGVGRSGLSDPEYKAMIRAKSRAVRSHGTRGDIVDTYAIATAPSTVKTIDHHPAGFRAIAIRDAPMTERRIGAVKDVMEVARSGGVDVTLTETLRDPILLSIEGSGFGSTMSRTL